jgi:hypothetical protein
VRLAAERRKYLRRVLALLSITADLADIDLIHPVRFENASLAFCESTSFLADCFALEPAVSDDWEHDFDLIACIRSIKDPVQTVMVRICSTGLPRAVHAAHFCATIRARP